MLPYPTKIEYGKLLEESATNDFISEKHIQIEALQFKANKIDKEVANHWRDLEGYVKFSIFGHYNKWLRSKEAKREYSRLYMQDYRLRARKTKQLLVLVAK